MKTKLYKAFIIPKPDAEACQRVAADGADGIETTMSDWSAAQARDAGRIARSNGLRIHSLMCGASLDDPNEAKRQQAVERLKQGLAMAAAYGADTILCVPGRIKPFGPKPSDLDLEFDADTCRIRRVVAGENAPYQDYIDAHNRSVELIRVGLETVAPIAAYEGVTIALENVWNNLLVRPEIAAAFVRSCDNRWIRSYFDVGNNLKYGPAEEWLRQLGPELIVKIHFKDFLLQPDDPTGGGFDRFVPIGHGNIDWFSLRDTMEEIGWSGWVTVEDVKHFTPKQHVQILDDIFHRREISLT